MDCALCAAACVLDPPGSPPSQKLWGSPPSYSFPLFPNRFVAGRGENRKDGGYRELLLSLFLQPGMTVLCSRQLGLRGQRVQTQGRSTKTRSSVLSCFCPTSSPMYPERCVILLDRVSPKGGAPFLDCAVTTVLLSWACRSTWQSGFWGLQQ